MLSRIRKQVRTAGVVLGLVFAMSTLALPVAAEPDRYAGAISRIELWIQWFEGMLASLPGFDLSDSLGKAGSPYDPGGLADPADPGSVDDSAGDHSLDSAGSSYEPEGRD